MKAVLTIAYISFSVAVVQLVQAVALRMINDYLDALEDNLKQSLVVVSWF